MRVNPSFMNKRIRIAFLFLIIGQGVHSVEEYYTGLWSVFAPARTASNLFSANTAKGFIIINTGLFVAGILCWILISSKNGYKFQPFIWVFIIIEFINGIGHPIWGIYDWHYVPGLISSLIILPINIYLTIQVIKFRISGNP